MAKDRGKQAAKLHKLIAKLSRPNRTMGSHLNPANKPDLRPTLARAARPGLNPEDSAYLTPTPDILSRRIRAAKGKRERAEDPRLSMWAETNPPVYPETGKTLPEIPNEGTPMRPASKMPGRRVSFKPRAPNTQPQVEDVIGGGSVKQGFHGPGNREGIQEMMYHRENPYGTHPTRAQLAELGVADTDNPLKDVDPKDAEKAASSFMKHEVKDPQQAGEVEEFVRQTP